MIVEIREEYTKNSSIEYVVIREIDNEYLKEYLNEGNRETLVRDGFYITGSSRSVKDGIYITKPKFMSYLVDTDHEDYIKFNNDIRNCVTNYIDLDEYHVLKRDEILDEIIS